MTLTPSLSQVATLLLVALTTTPVWAERTITDQLGRNVTLPDTIERAIVLQHQTLNILAQLDTMDNVVGVLDSWKKQLGPEFQRFYPALGDMATPGDLSTVNIEALLALEPDVVFVTNYAPADMLSMLDASAISMVAISLRKDSKEQAGQLNPSLADDEQAYQEGLKEGITLIGDIMNKEDQAKQLIDYYQEQQQRVAKRLTSVKPKDRVRVYMANPELATYGSGKYTGLMMEHAGATNVAAKDIKGFQQVSIEDVISWDPEVIFVQSRYPGVVAEINEAAAWQTIDAVKNDRVYLMPEYAKAWGYPMPEALALGEMWMAKQLYPTMFADIDMNAEADQYYQQFYGVSFLQPDETLMSWRINVLSLGDEEARGLAINAGVLRWSLLTVIAAIVSAQVAVSGSIGWVGLVIPHGARALTGPDHSKLLPASFMMGAIFMVLIDDIARTLSHSEIPLSILTAIIGAPVFVWLLRRSQSRG